MSGNINSFFAEWCSKNKFKPKFEVSNVGFLCEIRVGEIPYVGTGNAREQADATEIATRDFVNFLIRSGKINADDVPRHESNPLLEIAKCSKGKIGELEVSCNREVIAADKSFGSSPAHVCYTNDSDLVPVKVVQAYQPVSNDKDEHDPAIHGNWTVDNAKPKLNEYLQINKIDATYKYTSVGPENSRYFMAKMTLSLATLNRKVTACGKAVNKKLASKLCALYIVRQLYHLKVIDAFSSPLQKRKSEGEVKPPSVAVDHELMKRVKNQVEELGVQTIRKPPPDTNFFALMPLKAGNKITCVCATCVSTMST